MSDSSITLILNQLRQAVSDEDRQAAAAKLYWCYRGQVEKVARRRLSPGGGLADEEDVAQSAFRSFFSRIETGQLDALVTGGQAWAILARLARNKAIDSVRYDNALCRGGEGGRRPVERSPVDSASSSTSGVTVGAGSAGSSAITSNRLVIGRPGSRGRREDFPLEAIRDHQQYSGDELAESKEAIEVFLQQLSEATLRGIVSLKLQGFTNEEIAAKLNLTPRSIERKLNRIREIWRSEM